MSKASDKKVFRLANHSKAKIECYCNYLRIYLSILANAPFDNIYILDLFAGEGKDIDNVSCSSVAAAEAIRDHYNSGKTSCKKITFELNDSGNSVIEPGFKKIDRVKRFIDELHLPNSVQTTYSNSPFEDIIDTVIRKMNALKSNERALCFIDPFGYKYSKPEKLKSILQNGRTEVLLFIPICFMHRFAAKAVNDDSFTEGKHIEEFLSVLFQNKIPELGSQISFIKKIQQQFKIFLNVPYVREMYIEKDKNQYFALFFFSNNKLGFEKMLEAIWKIDEKSGKGFTVSMNSINPGLFDNIDHESYTKLLFDEIKRNKKMSNQEIFDFGLKNNHLPKHSNKVLTELRKEKKIKATFENGDNALAFYINDGHQNKIFVTSI